MRTFTGERCIQLLGLEAIEALGAKSEGARANFEQVDRSPTHPPTYAITHPPTHLPQYRRRLRSCSVAFLSFIRMTKTCKQLPAKLSWGWRQATLTGKPAWAARAYAGV